MKLSYEGLLSWLTFWATLHLQFALIKTSLLSLEDDISHALRFVVWVPLEL